ncbi:GspE/PulE family protein [Schlesneria paludicola]|uniref:GspE/PulE family protein n=1 Tax=Schlesneria paludicola TaxID=360056 RepID=UPI00029B0232|nr:ATPase, T2SS/T4P/T4SS family [Schlesneria paludicola]
MSTDGRFSGEYLANMTPGDALAAVITRAADLHVSDLFFLAEEAGIRVAFRRMGSMETVAALPYETGRSVITLLKAEAGIDLGDRRRPHEGRRIQTIGDRVIDLRINIIPTLHGEDVTARLLDRKFGLRSLEQIGLTRIELNKMHAMLNNPSGLVLVTGPTGTGKTTTLYGCLQYLNDGTRKINTLEDPVEYAVNGLRQSQTNSKIGLDFPELLRNILRQAPDVIMIGEVRDEETASTAVRAANSGTLVLSTLHSPVAAAAVQSMAALGVNRYFLSNCLLGVVAQRLARTLCPKCRVAYDISESPETFADIQPFLEPGFGTFIFGPGACDACMQQGYSGRTAIVELMVFNRALRQLVAKGCTSEELQAFAIQNGMLEFRRSAMVKVAMGVTSTEEVLRELPTEQLGLDL